MFDVLTFGDVLYDFTPVGTSKSGSKIYERNPGGSLANIACAVAHFGGKSTFSGAVGNDPFGKQLKEILEDLKVDISSVQLTNKAMTTVTFIELDESGNRSFTIYRGNGISAHAHYYVEESLLATIANSYIFHFSSGSQLMAPICDTLHTSVQYAKEQGCLISYDPNWRPGAWADEDKARAIMKETTTQVDILKLSDMDYYELVGDMPFEEGTQYLIDQGVQLVCLTLGEKGCIFRTKNVYGHLPAYQVQVIDTTGAGDIFNGALLSQLANKKTPIEQITQAELENIIRFANAAGSLSTTKYGAIPSIPDKEEVLDCVKNNMVIK